MRRNSLASVADVLADIGQLIAFILLCTLRYNNRRCSPSFASKFLAVFRAAKGGFIVASYIEQFDATPAAERWRLARGWLFGDPLPFFAELRRDRPILVMPEVTLATRFDDCTEIL